jgi:GNAT superfamily N-acetyltransferase
MPVVYFKRHRMQIDLAQVDWSKRSGPTELSYIPWEPKHLNMHAMAKWESFRHEIDANVFPCLGDKEGCRQLMRDLVGRTNFVGEATWLAIQRGSFGADIPIGTIQGLREDGKTGSIQNIGVTPAYRGKGIGKQLLLRALQGFQQTGCRNVQLEVTIHNLATL